MKKFCAVLISLLIVVLVSGCSIEGSERSARLNQISPNSIELIVGETGTEYSNDYEVTLNLLSELSNLVDIDSISSSKHDGAIYTYVTLTENKLVFLQKGSLRITVNNFQTK